MRPCRARCRLGLAGCAVAAVLPCVAVHAQSRVALSLRDAISSAQRQNLGVLAARARVDQARARTDQAAGALLPQLSASASEGERTFNSATLGIRTPTQPGVPPLFPPEGAVFGPIPAYDLRVRASLQLLDLGAWARLRAARSSVDVSAADAEQVAQSAATSAALLYFRVLRAGRLVEARMADSVSLASLVSVAREQVRAGVGIAVDVTRAESQAAAVRAQLIALRNDRDRAELELRRALGLSIETALILTDSLAPPRDADMTTEGSAMAQALARRPDLRVVSAQLAVQRRALQALAAEYLPAVALQGDQGVSGVVTSRMLPTFTWGLGIAIPIFDGLRRESRASEARAGLAELRAREQDLRLQAAIDVRGALLDLASAREEVDASRTRLGLAEQEWSQTRDRFAAGVTGNADVILASISLNGARTMWLDALASYHSARVALARAQGALDDLR